MPTLVMPARSRGANAMALTLAGKAIACQAQRDARRPAPVWEVGTSRHANLRHFEGLAAEGVARSWSRSASSRTTLAFPKWRLRAQPSLTSADNLLAGSVIRDGN